MRPITLQVLLTAAAFVCLSMLTTSARADGPASEAGLRPDASMNEKVLSIPGDSARPVELQATLYTPNGPGPFPLFVMNHGADGNVRPELQTRFHLTFSAYYFLSRGYAVVLPMMRGYAGSGGRMEHYRCDYENVGRNNARDIRAVIDYMALQPNIDSSRVVVAGESFGGWNTLALGTLHDPRVKGLINVAGGMGSSDCARVDAALAQAAGEYGANTRVPSIWFYGDNDKVFAPATWRGMHDSYTAAGGKAELVAFGNFMQDAHRLLALPEGLAIWTGKVDAFLDKVGLPSKSIYPEYLPDAYPPASNYAAIGDIDAVPYLNEQGKEFYRQFLKKPMPRAFVLDPAGFASSFSDSFDPLGKALRSCRQQAQNCRAYAVDDHVVWTRPTPTPAPTHFAAVQDVGAVPYLNEAGRRGYEQFLTIRKPRAFVIAPDGGWNSVSLGVDPVAVALQVCGKTHQGCQLYAADNDVVWPKTIEK